MNGGQIVFRHPEGPFEAIMHLRNRVTCVICAALLVAPYGCRSFQRSGARSVRVVGEIHVPGPEPLSPDPLSERLPALRFSTDQGKPGHQISERLPVLRGGAPAERLLMYGTSAGKGQRNRGYLYRLLKINSCKVDSLPGAYRVYGDEKTMALLARLYRQLGVQCDVCAENLANVHTTRTPEGGPYKRKECILDSACEMVIIPGASCFKQVYDPKHPDANKDGYVTVPNVDPRMERKRIADALSARRTIGEIIKKLDPRAVVATKGSRSLLLEPGSTKPSRIILVEPPRPTARPTGKGSQATTPIKLESVPERTGIPVPAAPQIP